MLPCSYFVHSLLAACLYTVILLVASRMNMLQDVYDLMSEDEKTLVVDWAKDQITQNFFNCTMKPPSDSSSRKNLSQTKTFLCADWTQSKISCINKQV